MSDFFLFAIYVRVIVRVGGIEMMRAKEQPRKCARTLITMVHHMCDVSLWFEHLRWLFGLHKLYTDIRRGIQFENLVSGLYLTIAIYQA